MKDLNKEPQVNPPKMSSPDLSKAEMEIRDRIEKSERGENMNNNSSGESDEDSSFHMNKKDSED